MITISSGITGDDRQRIEDILRSTNFFYEFEIATALELVDETIAKGSDKSGYYWLKAITENGLVGFTNYARNSFSTHSWELFWIAVHENFKNQKLGSRLLEETETRIRALGGKILWIETSGRPLYEPTGIFYRRNGYNLQASLKDFYGPGDPKHIYSKVL